MRAVVLEVKKRVDRGTREPVPVFDDDTSMVIEFDLHGTTGDLEKRLEQMAVSIFAIMAVEVPVAWALAIAWA